MPQIVDEPPFRNRIRVFEDRFHAGKLLAEKLREFKGRKDVYLLAIPAGGVQVAFEIARKLNLPVELTIVRKIHVPWNQEAGFGAISWDGITLLNDSFVTSLGLGMEDIERCVTAEKAIIRRREELFRGDKPFPDLSEKVAILVDDGIASGFSMLTAIKALEQKGIKEMVVAVPTAPINSINRVTPHVGRVICLNIRSGPFFAVADAYKVWYDLTDDDVMELLRLAKRAHLY